MREYMGIISFHEWLRHREKWQRLDDAVRRVARKLLADAVDNTKGDGGLTPTIRQRISLARPLRVDPNVRHSKAEAERAIEDQPARRHP